MTTRYRLEPQHITFIKDGEATKNRIENAFDDLIDIVEPQDNLIVYFSGHGRYNERRGGFWVPVEAGDGDKNWLEYVSNALIKDYLSRIKSFHTFLIADSCFSGSLFIDKALGELRDLEPSRWGLTSGKNEIVSDGKPNEKHSPFAAALLDVLSKADKPPSVMGICDLVVQKVAANEKQTPMGSPLRIDGHQGGQMVLYFRDDIELNWQIAQATNTHKAYSNFYEKHDSSKYAEEALSKMHEFEEKEKVVWDQVLKNREASLLSFIRENPLSSYIPEAKHLIDLLRNNLTPPLSILNMVLVKGGTFQMGEEQRTHPVTLSDFYMAKYPVTYEEYDAYCEAVPKHVPTDEGWGRGTRPVIDVNWFDAIGYCNWRSEMEGLQPVYQIDLQKVTPDWQANGYRIPTEAEWEYAAKGGQKKYLGSNMLYKFISLYLQNGESEFAGSNAIDEVAWYNLNSEGKTHPVGQKQPNELGIFDLSGNVWEWCWDRFGDYPSYSQPITNPIGPTSGSSRIIRGGSWEFDAHAARVARRLNYDPELRRNFIGFRLVRSI